MESVRIKYHVMEYSGVFIGPAIEVMRGLVTVTNKRILIDATDLTVRSIFLPGKRVVEPSMNPVGLALAEGQLKIFLNLLHGIPLILVVTIMICARYSDPTTLPEEALNINYQLTIGTGIQRHSVQWLVSQAFEVVKAHFNARSPGDPESPFYHSRHREATSEAEE